MEPILVSISEAGRLLSIGRTKTYGLIEEGILETRTIGSRRLVVLASIRALVERTASEWAD